MALSEPFGVNEVRHELWMAAPGVLTGDELCQRTDQAAAVVRLALTYLQRDGQAEVRRDIPGYNGWFVTQKGCNEHVDRARGYRLERVPL